MPRKLGFLLECDPGTTLGGSCLRDVKNMEQHLKTRCGFDTIHTFTTGGKYGQPANKFIDALKQFATSCDNADDNLIVVLVSGHGFQTPDRNGDETDGMDEMINIGSRTIIDDELNAVVLQFKCKAILLSDTCHSGTMFDLPFVTTDNGKMFIDKFRNTKTTMGNIISLSACSDQQLSMCDIGDLAGFGGSLTVSILEPNVLEDVVSFDTSRILKGYASIKNRVRKLNQQCVLSTT